MNIILMDVTQKYSLIGIIILLLPIIFGCFSAKRYNFIHGFFVTIFVGILLPVAGFMIVDSFGENITNIIKDPNLLSVIKEAFSIQSVLFIGGLNIIETIITNSEIATFTNNPLYLLIGTIVLWIIFHAIASSLRKHRIRKYKRLKRKYRSL